MARKRHRPKPELKPAGQLTGKQLAWIDAYLGEARFNGTKAARIAGYAGSDAVLASIARENLRKPRISRAIADRLKERHLTAEVILAELAAIALGGVPDLVEVVDGQPRIDWGRLLASGRMTAVRKIKLKQIRRARPAVAPRVDADPEAAPAPAVVEDWEGDWEVEWHDKLSALDKLGKALGLWDKSADASGADNPMMQAFRELLRGAGGKGRDTRGG